ncbi:MAG: hypothetical protein V7L21_32110 [Nostoc sp.]|uniref:hypothetical protein n=1 Tax=Nostoc sp. TaxID=1180 RepID=UPI002FF543C7
MLQLLSNFINSLSQRSGSSASKENKQINWFDTPKIGFHEGNVSRENIFADNFYKPTIETLQDQNPMLLMQWGASVVPASENAKKLSDKIESLEQEITLLGKEKYAAESAIQPLRREEYERLSKLVPYKRPWWHWLLVFGLSYSLFLGLNKHSDVELKRLKAFQYPIAALNLSAAVGITLSIKATMSSLGKRSKQFTVEPISENATSFETVAWWLRFIEGDRTLWIGLGFIILETCFAFPGLISILQTSLAKQTIYQIATFGASALSATANIALAWTTGLEEASHLHEQELKVQELNDHLKDILNPQEDFKIAVNNELHKRKIEATDKRVEELQEELIKQQELLSEAKENARLEYERWAYLMKTSFKSLESSSSQQIQNYPLSSNGHKKPQEQIN